MRRLVPLFLAALAIAILAGGLYRVLSRAPVPGTSQPQLATSTIAEETDTYTIDAQYPRFGIPAVDAEIKRVEDAAITELKAQPPVPHDLSVAKNSFYGRFDAPYIGPEYVSVELSLSQYTGGAHPSTIFTGLVFDRASGKRLALPDVLALIGKSLPELSASSSEMLARSLGDGFQFPEGAAATADNFSSFVIDAKSVTFILQQYQVAAYAAGPQRVSFPRVR